MISSAFYILLTIWLVLFSGSALLALPSYTLQSLTGTTLTGESTLSNKEKQFQKPNRLIFVGDVMLARDVDRRSRRAQSAAYPFERISFSNLPAYVIGNFEATMPVRYRETPPFTFTFAVPSTSASVITDAGFTHLSLANNHSLDFGDTGYEETVSYLSEAGLTVGGHSTTISSSSVVYLDTSSHRVAVVMLSVVGSMSSSTELQSVLRTAITKSDKQIVYVHWGNEYALTHSSSQEQLATNLVAWGADIIIGHHPHVVQDIAVINGVPVMYSLGNFIFDQYFSRDVQQGLVVAVDLDVEEIRLYPVTSEDSLVQPRFMSDSESKDFLNGLASRSTPHLGSQIENGVLLLSGEVASSTKAAIIVQ